MFIHKHVLTALAFLGFGVWPLPGRAQSDSFTVMDSIQMVHFNDPNGRSSNSPAWNVSPDGSTALLVTTRGIEELNVVESTLWILDLKAVAEYLEERNRGMPPSPREIYKVRGQLRALQSYSYGSLITRSRWAPDSKAIYMLVEETGGQRELDKVDVITKQKERLSHEGHSVVDYEIDSRGVFYSADQSQEEPHSDKPATADVVDTVRGSSYYDLLWPSTRQKRYLFRSDNDGVHLIAPAPLGFGWGTFSMSPDGSKIITLVPVEETPSTWERYIPGDPALPLYRPASQLSRTTEVLEYEVVDVYTHSRRPLLGTPSGAEVGYFDAQQVVWSSGGDHALLTNTFLPFGGQPPQEQEASRRPCAAAYVDVGNGRGVCIVFARSSKNESADSWAVTNIKFGRTDHDVIVHLSWRGREKTECYSATDDVWSENPISTCGISTRTLQGKGLVPIRLELTQSLDEPPSLWAQDVKTGRRSQIWNPNPQIAEKLSGKTSIYHWLDEDKREWTGGLILPLGFEPGVRYPLVIQTHGFVPEQYLVDGMWTTAMAARPLAAVGFVVLQIEDKYDRNMSSEEAKLHVNGYMAAIDQLAESGVIDPKRVGIIGFSRTCWFVEESLLELPERFAAAVIADGVDQSYFQYVLGAPEMPAMESERYNGGKPVGKGLDTWIKSAPGFRLSELKAPLRLQAIGAPSLLAEWEIYASLRIQNKPVDMVYFPVGQHILQNPAELMASEQGDVDWFRFWLQGYERPNPEDPNQYKRWEHLRELRDVDSNAVVRLPSNKPRPN
jgi:dipeptidyl aminopeptidase/acylaminoacyl peptidase